MLLPVQDRMGKAVAVGDLAKAMLDRLSMDAQFVDAEGEPADKDDEAAGGGEQEERAERGQRGHAAPARCGNLASRHSRMDLVRPTNLRSGSLERLKVPRSICEMTSAIFGDQENHSCRR